MDHTMSVLKNIKHLTATCIILCWCSISALANDNPNIVFILADDMGYGDLGCYGAERIKTPNIDRIAEEGILFTDGHCGASTCTPTRYGLMTGRHAWRSWCKYSALSTNAPLLIEEDRVTIASFLKSEGYATSIVGKWHLGYGHEEGFEKDRGDAGPNSWDTRGSGPNWNGELKPGPRENGFDYSYVVPVANSFPPYVFVENYRVDGLREDSPIGKLESKNHGKMEGGEGARWRDEELIDKFADKLVSELESLANKKQPFFLYYTPTQPHIGSRVVNRNSHWPNARFKGTSEAGNYGDVVQELDWSVGEILKTLDRLDLTENTLVIFTSDNGGYPRSFNGHQPNGHILRGGKGDLVEGGHRVPFLARWPGKIKPGIESKETISTTDMLATFAAIIGRDLPASAGPDSYNVLPALLGQKLPHAERPVVLSSGGTGAISIRAGKWKLIDGQGDCGYGEFRRKRPWPAPKPGDPPAQLYNLEEDLGEANNLYTQHPEIVHRLKVGLDKIKADENYNPTELEQPKERLSVEQLNALFLKTQAANSEVGRKPKTKVVRQASVSASLPHHAQDKPNVLFILVDDMGYSDLASYGHKIHETPNIDRLASEGMRFTDAYAAAPVCGPSRCAIMTGKFPSRTGFTDNFITRKGKKSKQFMPLKEFTLGEAFQAGGYQTGFVGKWHLDGRVPSRLPNRQGFDVALGSDRGPGRKFFTPYNMGDLTDGPEGEYLPDRLTNEAIRMMDDFSKKDQPWLMYLSFYIVHSPFIAKEEKVEKYREKATQANIKINAKYAGMVESMDENVGRMLEWLDERELRKDTVVVFTSDNGGFHQATHNRPLRSYKGHLYDGGIREPLIIDWPGVTKPGSVCSTPVHSTDFYPTLLEMTGLPLRGEQHLDGVSLVPLLKGEANFDRGPMIWHYHDQLPPNRPYSEPGSAIRIGDWKYLHFYEDDRRELYNLKNDIGEKKNLVVRMPEKAAEMKAQLDAMLKEHGATIPTPAPAPRKK